MRTALTRADRQARTREDLVDAAERLFTKHGFHATSVDAVADAAGYTKGAVYSNFESKEDLFFAVYERRVDRRVEGDRGDARERRDARTRAWSALIAELRTPRSDDGWLAVFFEFWAHVLRHPELRERFAEHPPTRIEPVVRGRTSACAERARRAAARRPVKLATARYAMLTGLQLERLDPARPGRRRARRAHAATRTWTKEDSMGYRIKRLQVLARGIAREQGAGRRVSAGRASASSAFSMSAWPSSRATRAKRSPFWRERLPAWPAEAPRAARPHEGAS